MAITDESTVAEIYKADIDTLWSKDIIADLSW
jgi:hypothetical protein